MFFKTTVIALLAFAMPIQETKVATQETETDETAKIVAMMQGTWVAESGEAAGQALPDDMVSSIKLMIEDKAYTLEGPQDDKGKVTIEPGKEFHKLLIQSDTQEEIKLKCILKIEDKTMKICYAMQGDYPTEFKTADTQFLMFTYKKKEDK